MEITKEVIRLLTRLMKIPLSEAIANTREIENKIWKDAVEQQIKDSFTEDRIAFNGNPKDTPEGFIMRRLGHLTANPIDKERTNAILESYIHYYICDRDAGGKGVVNCCEAESEKLIKDLIVSSKLQSRNIESSINEHSSKYMILHGERGCGKTCYLNYLLSKYSDHFDEKKVIWVRLDLANILDQDLDVARFVLAQEMKIIYRYYDPKSKLFEEHGKKEGIPASEHLDMYIKENWSSPTKKNRLDSMLDKADAIADALHDCTKDQILTPDFVPQSFSMETKKFALSKGYSIIVVLDGLDQLELSTICNERQKNIVKQTTDILKSKTKSREFYIVVSRTSTILQRQIPYFSTEVQKAEVSPVSLEKIIEKRICYIKTELRKNLKKWDVTDISNAIHNFDNFYKYLQKCETVASKDLKTDTHAKYLAFLDIYFRKNKRAAVQLIQLNYHNFLSSVGSKQYVLVENLCKSGKAYPPKLYDYYRNDENKLVRKALQEKTFDNTFLTSVYSFPVILSTQKGEKRDRPPEIADILLGTRILQIIVATERLVEKQHRQDDLLFSELVELCQTLFNYPRDWIVALTQEYDELQMIEIRNVSFYDQQNIDKCTIRSLPKTETLLNEFIFDIAYTNLAAMRIPLPVSLLDSEFPFLRALSLDSTNTTFGQWMCVKLSNATAVCQLIKYANTLQKNACNDIKNELSDSLSAIFIQCEISVLPGHEGMFDIDKNIEEAIKRQISKIIYSLDEDRDTLNYIRNELNRQLLYRQQ